MSRLNWIALPLMICLSTTSYSASTTPTCNEVLEACGKVVQAQKKQIEIRDLRIKQDEDQLKNVTDERNSAVNALGAWYRSPWLWLAVGAGTSAYLLKR